MSWVCINERKPTEGPYSETQYLITRFRGKSGGDCFENWNFWKNSHLEICFPDGTGHITHWWDGDENMDKAIENWLLYEKA